MHTINHHGTNLIQAAGSADKVQDTADGVQLNAAFMSMVLNSTTNQGVLLCEGRTWSTAPLVLTVYDGNNNQVIQVSLQLSLGARIMLLLHGINTNAAVSSLPTSIRYGEITNSGVPLGTLKLGGWSGLPGFSVFVGKTLLGIAALPEPAAQDLHYPYYATIGSSFKTAAEVDYTGDGCVPVTNQRFSTLLGFVGTKVPPLAKNIPPLALSDGTIVHTEAPHQTADLLKQLKVLAPNWFP